MEYLGTTDDYIYIISDNATSKRLSIKGAHGYNNGVTLLDNICDTCFTDKTKYPYSIGHNLKLEEILGALSNSNQLRDFRSCK